MRASAENKNGFGLFIEAFVQSWLAWGLVCLYVGLNLFAPQPSELWLGGLALGAVLLAMNGLARTELWLTSRSPSWFRTHPIARTMHYLHNEGEVAGVFVATIVLVCQLHRGHHPHFALMEAFTLLGIMSAANLAVSKMMPIIAWVESVFGKWGAIVIGSIISSFTGEPAAAVFLSEYFKERTPEEKRAKVATALGATIGSGGGLMPFSAPPILIVWATLQAKFGWGYLDLLTFVGGACVMHVMVVAWRMRGLVRDIGMARTPTRSGGLRPLCQPSRLLFCFGTPLRSRPTSRTMPWLAVSISRWQWLSRLSLVTPTFWLVQLFWEPSSEASSSFQPTSRTLPSRLSFG